MRLSDVQNELYSYFKQNSIFLVLMQFSGIITLIYPIYLFACRFNFLDFITGIIGTVSIILYFAYIIGLTISFAKREMLIISIALGIRAIVYLINIFIYSVSVNTVLSIIIYAALAVSAFRQQSNSVENR